MGLSLALLAAVAIAGSPAVHDTIPAVRLTVTVDSSQHLVILRSGPYDLMNMPPMEHGMMDMGMSHDTPVQHFAWPVQGWLRGFRVTLADAEGRPVPKHVMHHMIMVNFSRRQLVYHAS